MSFTPSSPRLLSHRKKLTQLALSSFIPSTAPQILRYPPSFTAIATKMVCHNFILPEISKPCLFLSLFNLHNLLDLIPGQKSLQAGFPFRRFFHLYGRGKGYVPKEYIPFSIRESCPVDLLFPVCWNQKPPGKAHFPRKRRYRSGLAFSFPAVPNFRPGSAGTGHNRPGGLLPVLGLSLNLRHRRNIISGFCVGPVRSGHSLLGHVVSPRI